MVVLRFRPGPQSTTICPKCFKRFKTIVALSWRFPNYYSSSRIITVLLRIMPMFLWCYWESCWWATGESSIRALSSEPVDGFWPNLHRYMYIVGRGERFDKILVNLNLFSRSQQHLNLKCPKYALSSEPVVGFWPNLLRYIVGRRGRDD